MNVDNYNRLKRKYKWYFILIVWGGIALGGYPSLEYALWLESVYPPNERDGMFDLLYLGGFFSFIFTGIVIITFLICKYKGWSRKQAIDYFIKYENLPSHWLEKE